MTGTQKSRSVQVKICGDVHGKAFRLWTEKNAEMLGLAGWVRNRCDGSVEAMFSGPADVVDEMIARCSERQLMQLGEGVEVCDSLSIHT